MPVLAHAHRRHSGNNAPCALLVLTILRLPALFLGLCLVCPPPYAQSPAKSVRIGVLAFRDDATDKQRWTATAGHLTAAVAGYEFEMVPLSLDAINRAVERDELQFILTSPGHYVALNARHGATRIATLRNLVNDLPLTHYGAVIFTRADRDDLRSLTDLRRRRFAAVSPQSFGGFQMAWWELLRRDIDPFDDLKLITTGFPHDRVVRAVAAGEADAGTVRTGVLESMAAAGSIRYEDFKILDPVRDAFPLPHSTALYPEWPFVKASHTPEALAHKVAIALLTLTPDSPAAKIGQYAGWTIPLDYSAVHTLLRNLHAAPYDEPAHASIAQLTEKYWPLLLTIVVAFVIGSGLLVYAFHLNGRLQRSSRVLEAEIQSHQQAKQELLSANARLQHLLTATPAMIYSCEPKPTWPVTFISDNVSTQLGHGAADFAAAPGFWLDHIHPDDRRQIDSAFDILLREGRHHCEYRFRHKDGLYRWLHDEMRLVRDANGRPLEVVGYWIDVTDRMRALELVRAHENELAHCLRLTTMGEMATALAHDINQPLAAVRNYVQGCLLRLRADQLGPPQLRHALEEILGQTERAAAVVKHIREFVSKEKPQRANVDVNTLITDAVRLVSPEARNAHIALHVELAREPCIANVNAIQVQQVLINIAHNAFEAMSGGLDGPRHLYIESYLAGQNLAVSLRDTGPGLTADAAAHIFDAFYTTKPTGMGMGLTISRTIIESHGGRLWAEPAEPRGMRFILTLPLARQTL